MLSVHHQGLLSSHAWLCAGRSLAPSPGAVTSNAIPGFPWHSLLLQQQMWMELLTLPSLSGQGLAQHVARLPQARETRSHTQPLATS